MRIWLRHSRRYILIAHRITARRAGRPPLFDIRLHECGHDGDPLLSNTSGPSAGTV
jgi:hypothetical protein